MRLLRLLPQRCPRGTPARASSAFPQLEVTMRAEDGSRAARRLRDEGLIPGVVYGGKKNQPRKLVTICGRALGRELREKRASVENTIYALRIAGGGAEELVVPRQIQLRAATSDVLSANFLRFSPDLVLRVPLRFVDIDANQSLRRGAYLHRVRHSLDIVCADASLVPAALDVSCRGKGKQFHGADVIVPEGVRLAKPAHRDWALAVVKTK
jgi:large subunit ribosomal protein L25